MTQNSTFIKLLLIPFTFCLFSLLSGCSGGRLVSREDACIDKELTQQLLPLAKEVEGDAGIYVRNLRTGQMAEINADTLFPTASMIKIPIMVGLFDKIERGGIKYHDELMYRDSLFYSDGDIIGCLKDSSKIELSKVVMLMVTTSDNTGSLWCQALADSGMAINEVMSRYGYRNTRVNSRTTGRSGWREVYGWGVTTPREMAELVAEIREGKIVSRDASERMYRNLCRIYWDGEALSQIPPGVQVASKQGAVNQSRSEVVLVNAPSGDYVFCVITKNQKDSSWIPENQGYVLLRKVSRLLWNYFEPDSEWKQPSDMKKWY